MSCELKNLLITVISGVSVYIISQWFTEFIIRPIQDYKKLKAKVAKSLILYAQYYSRPQICDSCKDYATWEEASNAIRELASEVSAFSETKPFHLFVFYAIPTKRKLNEASKNLIGLSNSFFTTKASEDKTISHSIEFKSEIKKNMRISH